MTPEPKDQPGPTLHMIVMIMKPSLFVIITPVIIVVMGRVLIIVIVVVAIIIWVLEIWNSFIPKRGRADSRRRRHANRRRRRRGLRDRGIVVAVHGVAMRLWVIGWGRDIVFIWVFRGVWIRV